MIGYCVLKDPVVTTRKARGAVMNEHDMVSVIDVARELGKRKQTIFKVMRRLGISAVKRRDTSKRNQDVSYITRSEFDRIRAELGSQNNASAPDDNGLPENGFYSAELGVFYLIQLEPTHDPQRFKVGFAANMPDRLRAIRCSAPFATILKTWPCRRLWEKTAIDCVCAGCEQVHTEVFRANCVDEVIARCDRFFEMMPALSDVKENAIEL
jgi:hypothetical protein